LAGTYTIKPRKEIDFLETLRSFLSKRGRRIAPIYLRNQFLIECCLIVVALGSVSSPFAYGILFLLEDAEPYRRLIRDVFGITEVNVKFIPFVFYICFQTLQWFNVCWYITSILALFIYTMNEWLVSLTTIALRRSMITFKQMSETSSDLIILQEQLADHKLLRSYQVLRILTRLGFKIQK